MLPHLCRDVCWQLAKMCPFSTLLCWRVTPQPVLWPCTFGWLKIYRGYKCVFPCRWVPWRSVDRCGCCSSGDTTFFLRQVLLLAWDLLSRLWWLANIPQRPIFCFSELPAPGLQACTIMPSFIIIFFLMWTLTIKCMSLCLQRKHLTGWIISPLCQSVLYAEAMAMQYMIFLTLLIHSCDCD